MKSNALIIILIILIFLGILWLNYNKREIKEGLTPENSEELANDIIDTVNDKLVAAGVDTSSFTNQLPGFIDQVTGYLNDAANIVSGGAIVPAPSDIRTAVDTTGRDNYPGKTFFTGTKFSDSFCQTYTDPTDLNNKCSTLTTENCNQTDCCIVLNGKQCVAGNALGPANTVDTNGKDIDYAYYSYKNECYGSCGKGLASAANPCSGYTATDTGLTNPCITRLWKQTKCPNQNYINPALVTSLQGLTKAEIDVKFKNTLTDEVNYADCYGPNQTNWPVPCYNTTDASKKVSKRCLTQLVKDVGCKSTEAIDDAYTKSNSDKTKLEMVNTFRTWLTASDDETLTKCYGTDQFEWPDPCAGIPDSALIYQGQVPLRCAKKLWKENTGCPETRMITQAYRQIAAMSTQEKNAIPLTKKQFLDWLISQSSTYQENRFQCYGVNPNKWPDGMGIIRSGSGLTTSDPCSEVTSETPATSVPIGCRNRLTGSDVFPTENCKANLTTLQNALEKSITDTNYTGPISDVLINLESRYKTRWCPVPKMTEFILGVGTNNNLYTKPASNLSEPWTDRNDGQNGRVWSFIQLNDETFLGLFMDDSLWTKKSLESTDPWQRINRQPCCTGTVIQLTNGTFVAVGQDRKLYKRATLDFDDWSQIPNSGDVVNISLIKIGTAEKILGINIYNQVYTRPATTDSQSWTYQEKFGKVRAITQLKNGTYVAAGMDYKLYTKTNIDAAWVQIPNSGDVINISTINIMA